MTDLTEQARAVAGHTPGPWHINPEYDTMISTVSGDADIAEVDGWPMDLWAEQEANKHLIAAAPDLLAAHLAWEAAEDARNDCNDYDDGCDNEGPWEACPLCSERFGHAIDLRHAAIAKATGAVRAELERGR